MGKREVDEFEQALQRAARGEAVEPRVESLVQAARQAAVLSEPVPPAPHGLGVGRRRLLAEAARLRAQRLPQQQRLVTLKRLATLAAFAIVLGVVLGVGSAAAGSLPGQPLYGLKLLAERTKLGLIADPVHRAAETSRLAEKRLDEITVLLGKDVAIEEAWAGQAERQLRLALQAAAQLEDGEAARALGQLAAALEQRQRVMGDTLGEPADPPVQELLRVMEQVREEAHAGERDLEGLRRRLRQGAPLGPTALPDRSGTSQPSMTPKPPEAQQRTGMPSASPGAYGTPASGPGCTPTPQPSGGPTGPHTPGASATARTPEPPHASEVPGASRTAAPTAGADHTPGPGQTPGPGGGGGGNKP